MILGGISKASDYKYPRPLEVVRKIGNASIVLDKLKSRHQDHEESSTLTIGARTALLEESEPPDECHDDSAHLETTAS